MGKKNEKAEAQRLYAMIRDIAEKTFIPEPRLFKDEDLFAEGYAEGSPFDVHLRMFVSESESRISIFSILPYEAAKDRIRDVMERITSINYCDLASGCYTMDREGGRIIFSYPLQFKGSLLSRELLEESIRIVCETVTRYNTELFKLSGGEGG